MRKMLIGLVTLAALTGAACSSNNGDGGGSPSGAAGGTGATGAGCTSANALDLTGDDPFTVTIQGRAFHPDCFAAKSASSIIIQNQDSVTHTFTIDGTPVDVTIEGGTRFDGTSAGLAPGTYPFHCKIHTTMTGTVIVS
jgi:plastocyanin